MDVTKIGPWTVGPSIAIELELVLGFVTSSRLLPGLPAEFNAVMDNIPDDWRQAWDELWDEPKQKVALEMAARLAGVLEGDDYARVSMAIRELSPEAALERLLDPDGEIVPDPDLPPVERLVDYEYRSLLAAYEGLGLDVKNSGLSSSLMRELKTAVRILAGGDLSTRFWHLVDRFFYETYQPWRRQKEAALEEAVKHRLVALGSSEQVLALDWLPAQNPLLRYPELNAAVRENKVEVFFWAEPVGIADMWSLEPGRLLVSFSETGVLYQNFMEWAQDVARRASALGDPTRLIILRLIRNFGMVNTSIAEYLGISRPTVSVHAKILRQAGLIRSRQDGRLMRHEINVDEVRRLFQDLENFLDLPPE
jgi:ArsR family transcriptional regulator